MSFLGCSSLNTTQKGAAIGGLGGAAAGGLVGSAVHHPVAGALIGGALGAGGGALIGNQLQGHEEVQQQQQQEINRQSSELNRQREELQRIKKQGEYWYQIVAFSPVFVQEGIRTSLNLSMCFSWGTSSLSFSSICLPPNGVFVIRIL
jgi:outer membrane lipoprotein SlyB